MTPKQTAIFNTFAVLAIGAGGGLAVFALFSLFTLAEISIGIAAALLIAVIKLTYNMELSKAEALAKLNELSKK